MSLAAAPPTGTLTFLFTDIAGSTRLWDHYPDAMRPALARHDTLLRQSIEDNSGFVFKTVGDAFCAAFAVADDALQAALAAQLALQAEPWDLPEPMLVRMALHTGAAEERGGDYFGPPLNRVARLLTVGHGGQSLLSEVTQGLVRDALPAESAFRNLGAHRLKDLGRSEQVFQLLHPNLPAEFPSLRSLGNPNLPNNLPYHITSFIGRENETLAVKTLTQASRLVTLVGSGGAGKSRLSLQVAADLLEHFPDGAWFVELAPLSDPTLVSQEVADVLGVREAAGKTVPQGLMEWLMPRRLLLVLDNCEHLIGACAALVTDLLRNCPGVHLLASSRERLGVSGERVYRVPSLALPDLNQTQTLESLSQYEAVTLFLERAQAAQPSFSVTNANAAAIASVCHRLDGIPLALELAAARLRSLSVEEVNARLDNRFRLLTGGSRTALPRQQTLRALIDWSYDLLTVSEKAVLCRLSVFVDGWTLEAAEAVCSGGSDALRVEEFEVLDLLASLADKSLAAAETKDGGTRYRFLETVRQYASDRLRESGEVEAVCGRSAGWFLGLAEAAELHLLGPEQTSWLGRLEIEHDNLRASLLWYEHSEADNWNEQVGESAEGGLRLVGALWRFWFVRGHYSEGRQWSDRALERAKEKAAERVGEEAAVSASRAKALNGAGNLADEQGDYAGARKLYEESLTLQRRLADPQSIAGLLSNLGSVAAKQGDYPGSRALFEESLSVFRQLGNLQGVAGLLGNLGIVAADQGDYAGARAMYEESLTVFRQLGNPQGIAASLNNLANVLSEQGDHGAARVLHEESLTLQRQLGSQRGIANSLSNLGSVAVVQGDFALAKVLVEESLALNRQIGNQRGIANALGNLGKVAFGQGNPTVAQTLFAESLAFFRELGDPAGIADALGSLGSVALALSDYAGAREFYGESLAIQQQLGHPSGIVCSLQGMAGAAHGQRRPLRAAQLWGAVHTLRQSIGSFSSPAEQEEIDKETAPVREALGDTAFSAAWAVGQGMTLEQAAQYALATE